MHDPITIGMVLWFIVDVGCVLAVLGVIALALKIIGSGWNH